MSIPPDINTIFDIDMDLTDNDINNILDTTDGVSHMWKEVEDDEKTPEKLENRMKIYSFSVEEYKAWIASLEKAGFHYILHDHWSQFGNKKKFQ